MHEGLSVADAMALSNSRHDCGDYGCGLGGGMGMLFLLFALMGGRGFGCGFGGGCGDGYGYGHGCGGYGYGGPGYGYGGYGCGYGCESPQVSNEFTRVNDNFLYTNLRGDMQAGFAGAQRDADRTEGAINCGFKTTDGMLYNMNTTNLQGFNCVDKSLCQGFGKTAAEIAQLSFQQQQCCCDIERDIDSVKFENAKNTCDIIQAANCNTQKIIDTITCNEIQTLRDKLQDEKFSNSQLMQNQYLVGQLQPVSKPAYITCSPYASCSPCGFGGFGFDGGRRFDRFDNDCCGCRV